MIKLPSLTKKPKYQKFHIEPRYYDPVREDIENRTSRIKAELGMSDDADLDAGYASQISGSFRKNLKHTQGGKVDQTSMIRLIVLIVLVAMVGGFVYIGSDIFYILLLYVPFYLWKKLRK